MINYSKYKYTGWGLSQKALKALEKIIIDNNINNVLEFGSGQSTYFFKDLKLNHLSIDNDINFSAKVDNVIITNIKQTDDILFSKIINNEIDFEDLVSSLPNITNIHTRMRNCFYDVSNINIDNKFDLVSLDGPHGNGRSIAFNYIKKYINDICYILVDDYNHYPFVEHLKLMFPNNILVNSNTEKGDNWALYKVTK